MNVIYIVVFLVLMVNVNTYAQSDEKNNVLTDRLEKQNERLPQEKVHIHFDKTSYVVGDTIWFAGYIVNALKNTPAEHSRILYVELINSEHRIIKTLQLPVNTGFAAGDFTLPDSLGGGLYEVRAYTSWMKNFDNGFFFKKRISVMPVKVQAAAEKRTTNSGNHEEKPSVYDVYFFPEGGQLVDGLASVTGFKAVAQNGEGVQISGRLTDELNQPVLEFHSGYGGIGSFSFTPFSHNSYIAIVKLPDGSEKRFKLPEVKRSGYVLSAENSGADSLYIRLQATPDLLNKENMTFIPLSNGMPLFYMQTKFPDKQINITVPKSKLAGGILQLTLLNEQYEPVAERLVFNRYLHRVSINLIPLRPGYRKKEKIELVLQALDIFGKPVTGSFSMAVTHAGQVDTTEDSAITILSNLLLSADFPGDIAQPNYYFTQLSVAKEQELDQLMLTQKWRRFAWRDLITGRLPEITYPLQDLVEPYMTAAGMAPGIDTAIKLKEVMIKSRHPKLANSHSANLNGAGQADQVILPETLEKIADLSSLSFLLHGLVPFGTGFKLTSTTGTLAPGVLILVDGVSGIDDLREISPRDVESIEFLKTVPYTSIYGIRGAGGVILITTKKGNIKKQDITIKSPNSLASEQPFYTERRFYQHGYGDPGDPVKTKDVTVYWKPDIITDKNGKATLSFYSNDVTGNYNIVIEGLSARGGLSHQVFSYRVE